MSSNLTRTNRIRYTIYGNTFGSRVIKDPRNWNNDSKELIRSDKYQGLTANITNSNLEFYGAAFILLKGEYDVNGIKANVRIERESRNDNTDEWELDYIGYFDFSTYNQNKNFIKIKLDENKFFKNIENRFKDQFELDRLDDLKGGTLPPLEYKKLSLQGRDIFRESYFDNDDEIIRLQYEGSDSFTALVDIALPLNLKFKSDENIFSPATIVDSGGFINLLTAQITRLTGDNAQYNAGLLFYLTSPITRNVHVNIKLDFRAKFNNVNSDFGAFNLYFDKVVQEVDGDFVTGDSVNLVSDFLPQAQGVNWKNYSVTYDQIVALDANMSLGLRLQPFFGSSYAQANRYDFEFSKIEVTLDYTQIGATTECDCLTYYQVFQRLIEIITGKDAFTSNLLSGQWNDLLFTNGFKIRQIPDKSITTSLEEVYNSINSHDDVALKIKNNTIQLEAKEEVYLQEVSIDLGVVNEIEREIDEKTHLTTIEIGSDFNGLYEEVVGLDEFNIKNTYTTCLDTLDNKLSAISKVRTDSYGITLAQDKQYEDNPKLDTKYDKYNFAIDAYKVGQTYYVRHWELDFITEPTGIYSVDTAFNLRLSPFNSLLRKGKTISIGLKKYPTELLKYSSTEGNSQLVTLYPERAIVANSILASPYFLPEIIKFKKKISMAQFKILVDNPYKLIKFENEFGSDEYGYIISVKPNKEGNFELYKANL